MPSSEDARPDHALYDAHYHDTKEVGSRNAADAILALTLELIDVESVLDMGCGYGSWLATAEALGVRDVTGVEGPWAAEWRDRGVLVADFDLVLTDLEAPLVLDSTFDLVICQETAEHLTASRADGFVAELCAASTRAVLFGAAIPGQGGPNHVNEVDHRVGRPFRRTRLPAARCASASNLEPRRHPRLLPPERVALRGRVGV